MDVGALARSLSQGFTNPQPGAGTDFGNEIGKILSVFNPVLQGQQMGQAASQFRQHPDLRSALSAILSSPVPTGEVLPAGRFQSTPMIPEFSQPRAGTFYSMGRPDRGWKLSGPMGGQNAVTTSLHFSNPLKVGKQMDALEILMGPEKYREIVFESGSRKLLKALQDSGVSREEIGKLLRMTKTEDERTILWDRLTNQLARRAGYDGIIHTDTGYVVDLHAHPGYPGSYPALKP